MTERQLLQYYMWLSFDAAKFCSHAEYDYGWICKDDNLGPCFNCPYWDPDLDAAMAEAEEDIAKMTKGR